MKVFLIFGNHGAEAAPIIRALKKHSHQVIYWVGAPNSEVKSFPEIIFHYYKDASFGLPAPGVDAGKYPPPSAHLIRKLYGVESMEMLIMNKLFPHLPFEERRHMYYEQLRYWLGVLEEYRPDAIVFPLSPASNYNYLLANLAKLLGIKTIMFSDTWVSDRTFVHSDLWEASPKLLQEMQKNQGRQFLLDDLSPDLRDYYLKQTGKNKKEAIPWYISSDQRKYTGLNHFRRSLKLAVKSLNRPRTLLGLSYNFFASRIGPNCWKEYGKYQVKPDYQKKYVYVPMQFQPERTTTPLGDVFADLIYVVETVAAALPEGWVAYVKEHPVQWFRQGRRYSPYRYPGYYERIARIPKVFLVPTDTNSHELINKSQAVATVNGTPAWEAVMRCRPSVIFGYSWFRDCPLVFKAEDTATCRAAFEKIKNGYQVETQAVINFLKSFDDATFHCYMDDPMNTESNTSELTSEQRLNNIAEKIISELYVK